MSSLLSLLIIHVCMMCRTLPRSLLTHFQKTHRTQQHPGGELSLAIIQCHLSIFVLQQHDNASMKYGWWCLMRIMILLCDSYMMEFKENFQNSPAFQFTNIQWIFKFLKDIISQYNPWMFWAFSWLGGNRRWMYQSLLVDTEQCALHKWLQLLLRVCCTWKCCLPGELRGPADSNVCNN